MLEDKKMQNQIPIEELLYEEEGTTLDFKQKQYIFESANEYQKSELIKDILAFSNAWRRSDAYILIGVEEVKGGRSRPLGIEKELDDAQLQQFVNSKTQKPINFTYKTILVDGIKIGIIWIPTQSRPYYLEKNFGKLKKHTVYIRRGSSTDEASPEEVHSMGRAEVAEAQEVPDLNFEFASLEKRISLGEEKSIEKVFLDIPPIKSIPDYREEESSGPFGIRISSFNLNHLNPDYYRNIVKYYYVLKKSEKLSFSLKNNSSITVSDIRVEIIIEKQGNKFTAFTDDDFPDFPRSEYNAIANIRPLSEQIARNAKPSIKIQDLGDKYRIEVPFEKTLPKQTIFCDESIFIASNNSFEIRAQVLIYADNIPSPLETSLAISCKVIKAPGSLKDIMAIHSETVLTKYSS